MNSPFKFLDSYSKEDKDIFFGRDSEIEELYQKVFASKILLMFGVSGTGKSSLIDCGLGNKIADSDWLPISIRRGSGMVESLMTQLDALDSVENAGRRQSPIGSGETVKAVVKKIKSVYLDHFKPIYLIFDQFEELFIFGSKEERTEFIAIVKAIMVADVQCKMLFSIREEYLANITEFERVVPEIMMNRMRVGKMSRKNAMEVISGPCKVHGIELEDGFAEALMTKLVPEGNEVELTYLQVYLDKVFRMSIGRSPKSKEGTQALSFTLSQLEELGNVGDLLGSFLEDQITQLDNPESGLAVLKSFVSIRGTKRQITHKEVLESCKTLGTIVEDDALKELINKFVDLRILRDKDENGRYELRHDSLAAKIFEKITMVEKEVMEVRLFIENAYDNFKKRKKHLTDDDLKYIAIYEPRLFLNKEQDGFLRKSKSTLEAKKIAFIRIMRISMVGFLFMVGAMALYLSQRMKKVTTDNMVLEAMIQMESSPMLGLETAFKAYDRDTAYSLSKKAIYDGFHALVQDNPAADSQYFHMFNFKNQLIDFGLSGDGKILYVTQNNNEISVLSEQGELLKSVKNELRPIHIEFSNDNQQFVVLDSLGKLVLLNLSNTDQSDFYVEPRSQNNQFLYDFSDRESHRFALVNGKKIDIFNSKGGLRSTLEMSDSTLTAVDFSPDNRFLAAASSDNYVYVWYFNKNIQEFAIYDTLKGHSARVNSCQFSSNSKYVLTTSADSSFLISDIYGGVLPFSDFNFNAYRIKPYYGNEGHLEEWKSLLDNEILAAEFSTDNRAIYITSKHSSSNMDKDYLTYILHWRYGNFFRGPIHRYLWQYIETEESIKYNYEYDALEVSNEDKYILCSPHGSKEYNMFGIQGIKLMQLFAKSAHFSADDKCLYVIQGKSLKKIPLDIEEINTYLYVHKIFGETKGFVNDWIIY
jgi:WD40 repeat protein